MCIHLIQNCFSYSSIEVQILSLYKRTDNRIQAKYHELQHELLLVQDAAF